MSNKKEIIEGIEGILSSPAPEPSYKEDSPAMMLRFARSYATVVMNGQIPAEVLNFDEDLAKAWFERKAAEYGFSLKEINPWLALITSLFTNLEIKEAIKPLLSKEAVEVYENLEQIVGDGNKTNNDISPNYEQWKTALGWGGKFEIERSFRSLNSN